METRNRADSSATLLQAQEQFDSWRQNRTGRTAVPCELWSTAVNLCSEYSVSKVSRLLRVHYTELKKRVQRAGGQQLREPATQKQPEGCEFIELPAAEQTECSTEWIVETSEADGSQMRVHTSGQSAAQDVMSLLQAFWSRAR